MSLLFWQISNTWTTPTHHYYANVIHRHWTSPDSLFRYLLKILIFMKQSSAYKKNLITIEVFENAPSASACKLYMVCSAVVIVWTGGLFWIPKLRTQSLYIQMEMNSSQLCVLLQVRVLTATLIIFPLNLIFICNKHRVTDRDSVQMTLILKRIEHFVFQMAISLQLGHMTITSTYMLWLRMARSTAEQENAP